MTWGDSPNFCTTPLLCRVSATKFTTTTPYPKSTANMVLAKSKKSVGLGNSLMNDRFGKGKGADMRRGAFQQGIERTGQNGEKVFCCREGS
jgi:hypothetical protein